MNNDINNLLGSTEIGTIFLDTRLNIKRFTPATTKIFNLIQTDLDRPISDITTKIRYDHLQKDAKKVLDNLIIKEAEVQDIDGNWYSMRIAPYRTIDNVIDGVVITFVDINKIKKLDKLQREIEKRKKAEEALRESEERLQSFMDSATDGFILFDSELNHIEMNKAALEMTGLERKDVIGKNVIDTVPNIKGTSRYDKYKKVMKTGVPLIIPDLISHPLTGDKHIELKAFKVSDGLGIIFTDITERKQGEEALRHSELWMRNIFNSIKETVIVVTPDRKIVNINEAGERMFGYSKDELTNLSTEVLHIDHEHYVKFERLIKGAFDRSEAANFEFKAKRKNGEVFQTEHTVSLLENDAGERIGISSIVRDITERKKEKSGPEGA
jgi:two-component system CheB/CheR fusion protein